jgi:hypothetical protein
VQAVRDRYGENFRFSHGLGREQTSIGAPPQFLVRASGGNAETMAAAPKSMAAEPMNSQAQFHPLSCEFAFI